MSAHPDASLTLREAYERHYDKSELCKGSLRKMHYAIAAWEKLTTNPPIGEITNATAAGFRQAAIDHGYHPRTVNGYWGSVRSILRLMGPVVTGNPWALGIVPNVPAMKPCRVVKHRPRVVSQEDLSRLYVACRHADKPRTGVAAADWWRCLIVVAYFTGLRRSDLFALEWSQLDLAEGTLDFTARKTGKADIWPLHPVAITHLERLRTPKGGRVFRGMMSNGQGRFYHILHELEEVADIEEPFGLHDLRRTGASLIEEVTPGLGPEFLQHSPHGVSDVSYLNRFNALKATLEKMPVPAGFRSGPKVAANREAKAREDRVKMRQEDFIVPTGPNPADWKFRPGAFWYRDRWHRMPSGIRLAILQRLVSNPEPASVEEIVTIAKAIRPHTKMATPRRVSVMLCDIRSRLRRCFGLTDGIDPIPCVQRIPPAWSLWIPNP